MTSISTVPSFLSYQSRDTADMWSDTKSSGQQAGQLASQQTARAAATPTISLADEISKITGDRSAMQSDFASLNLGRKLSTIA